VDPRRLATIQPVVERNETHTVRIRKPITTNDGILAYGEDCFRLGSQRPDGTHGWDYEIPFAEITQIEHKAARDIVRGKLRDGSEFEFRFSSMSFNPAKTMRQAQGLQDALGKIAVAQGGSLRAVEQSDGDSRAAPSPGCMGCGSGTLASAIVIIAAGLAIRRSVR
jgi:hypothetical protein